MVCSESKNEEGDEIQGKEFRLSVSTYGCWSREVFACGLVLCCFVCFSNSLVGQDEVEIEGAEEVPVEIPADLLEPTLQSRSGPGDRLARVISPELRRLEFRQSEIVSELDKLPQFSLKSISPVEFGYHASPNKQRPKWVQLDLGRSVEPDAVALIPVTVQFEGRSVPGYGFPRAFRIDISDDEKFSTYQTLVDYQNEGSSISRLAPFFAKVSAGNTGRYVRLTVTQLWNQGGDASAGLLALAELMVLKGQRNLAYGKPVSARDSVERNPLWLKRFVNDGRTPLGIPYSPQVSPSLGYSTKAGESPQTK